MIVYVDNGQLLGWYYKTNEGFYYGDGTKECAETYTPCIVGDGNCNDCHKYNKCIKKRD